MEPATKATASASATSTVTRTACRSSDSVSSPFFGVRIVSAWYGPHEGLRLLTGEWSDDPVVRLPCTRDVAPFLRAMLRAQQLREEQHNSSQCRSWHQEHDDVRKDPESQRNHSDDNRRSGRNDHNPKQGEDHDDDPDNVCFSAYSSEHSGGMKRARIHVLDGIKGMNAVFGDPCPGISKRLHVHYVVTEQDDPTAVENLVDNNGQDDEQDATRHPFVDYTDHQSLSMTTSGGASTTPPSNPGFVELQREKKKMRRCLPRTEEHVVSFAEHERVVLRRRRRPVTMSDDPDDYGVNNDGDKDADDHTHKQPIESIRRSIAQSTSSSNSQPYLPSPGFEVSGPRPVGSIDDPTEGFSCDGHGSTNSKLLHSRVLPFMATSLSMQQQQDGQRSSQHQWRLRSATSEIVLPMIMPYLNIRERVQCQLVCTVWRNMIRYWGVAYTIDNNDPNFPNFNRPFLLGLLSNSYSSLQCLLLGGCEWLQKDDLHPSIPYLRKLRSLDVSRCIELDDTTLQLLAGHCPTTLRVLFIKGLGRVTDNGMIAICQSYTHLHVLDISHISNLTDASGVAIGSNLTQLTAIYMRDNYQLTNQSIDAITQRCSRLEQLTLWGCSQLQHLRFQEEAISNNNNDAIHSSKPMETTSGYNVNLDRIYRSIPCGSSTGNLVMLNLWGCHNLRDDSAMALTGMENLKSLIVSECHRLTDAFLVALSQSAPQLHHLHLRYCKRLTDNGVQTISHHFENLYSLDLSFCTKVTSAGIYHLLKARITSMAELRIQSCHKLDIGNGDQRFRIPGVVGSGGHAGHRIIEALRANGDECSLSMLDVRDCGGQQQQQEDVWREAPNHNNLPQRRTVGYANDDPFVQGMGALGFEQKVPGFFARAARWNRTFERRFVEQLTLADFKRQDTIDMTHFNGMEM